MAAPQTEQDNIGTQTSVYICDIDQQLYLASTDIVLENIHCKKEKTSIIQNHTEHNMVIDSVIILHRNN